MISMETLKEINEAPFRCSTFQTCSIVTKLGRCSVYCVITSLRSRQRSMIFGGGVYNSSITWATPSYIALMQS